MNIQASKIGMFGIRQSVSSRFFVGSIAGGNLAGVLLVVVGSYAVVSGSSDWMCVVGAVTVLIGVLALIYGYVTFHVLLYKAWNSIQDGSTRMTARRAVGFLFIPIFNLWWIFTAIPGFADEYNTYINRANIPAPALDKRPLKRLAVYTVLSHIPAVGGAAALGALIARSLVAKKLCDAINALSTYEAV